MRRSREPGFTLKHLHRRNQVRHTGGTVVMKIYEKKLWLQTKGVKEAVRLIPTLHQQD